MKRSALIAVAGFVGGLLAAVLAGAVQVALYWGWSPW
jgi:hypothetical protein